MTVRLHVEARTQSGWERRDDIVAASFGEACAVAQDKLDNLEYDECPRIRVCDFNHGKPAYHRAIEIRSRFLAA